MTDGERSLATVTTDDLARLARIARQDREDFFVRKPHYRALADRVVAVTLCQGAALHFLDGQNGVKDFDVWTFYAAHPDARFPARRIASRDFGDSRFGRSPDRPEFVGRKVDLLGRSIDAERNTDPAAALRTYLSEGRTAAAYHLARKAVVLLEPAPRLGEVVWPVA